MSSLVEFEQWVFTHEALLRGLIFLTIFVVMLCLEIVVPRRPLQLTRAQRWSNNIGLFMLNNLLLRWLFPAAAVGIAISVNSHGWGLLNLIALPFWIEFLLALLVLDLAIYLQHRVMHHVPWLWRLHRVHHADLDFDLTTGFRFHTFEILFSMLIKWGVLILLGPAVIAVFLFEVILNGMAVFNHSNISLPEAVESCVRKILVTPDMHRVHHSVEIHETNSNYGFNLSIWDRLLGTYCAEPDRGHDSMVIGLSEFRNPSQVDRLDGMLMLPFGNR